MSSRNPTIARCAAWNLAAGLALALLTLAGCSTPKVYWSQRVVLNGRTLVFSSLDSLQEVAEGHRIRYRQSEFVIEGRGPIAVNGFEIEAEGSQVVLANQPLRDLAPGDEIHFRADMSWSHKRAPASAARSPGQDPQAPPVPAPAAPAGASPSPAVDREGGAPVPASQPSSSAP